MGRPSQPFSAAEVAAYASVEAGEITRYAGAKVAGIAAQTFRERMFRWQLEGRPGASEQPAPEPAPVAAAADEWTIPTARTGHVAQVVQERKAPAHGGKWKRFIAASDIHGDMQDEAACGVLWKFLENWNPSIRCCLGDVWDFRPMRNGASNEEKQQSMATDYQMGLAWLERFFAADGQKILTLGNHDARLWEFAYNRRGLERDFAAGKVEYIEAKFSEMGIEWVPYHKRDGVVKLGHLKMLHGFHCGVYAARQTALVYGSCLMGHVHAIDEHHIPGLERRAARIIGALCRLDMDYNARQPNTLRQANGFAYGVLNSITGDYHVWQAESHGGEWLMPSDLVEVAA